MTLTSSDPSPTSATCFIGCYTDGGDFMDDVQGKGLASLQLDPATGQLGQLQHVADLHNPSWVQVDDEWIWVASEHFSTSGAIHALRRHDLSLQQSVDSGGLATCHLLADGQHLTCSSYLMGVCDGGTARQKMTNSPSARSSTITNSTAAARSATGKRQRTRTNHSATAAGCGPVTLAATRSGSAT